jgi:hypothetical protein
MTQFKKEEKYGKNKPRDTVDAHGVSLRVKGKNISTMNLFLVYRSLDK